MLTSMASNVKVRRVKCKAKGEAVHLFRGACMLPTCYLEAPG